MKQKYLAFLCENFGIFIESEMRTLEDINGSRDAIGSIRIQLHTRIGYCRKKFNFTL